MTLLFFWSAGLFSFGAKLYETAFDTRCIVVAKEADVLAGPETKDTVLFRLHEGTTVTRERFDRDFSLISLPDGKRGWIRAAHIEGIMSPLMKRALVPW